MASAAPVSPALKGFALRRPIRHFDDFPPALRKAPHGVQNAGEFLGHLLALGSVFFAGYLWLLLAA